MSKNSDKPLHMFRQVWSKFENRVSTKLKPREKWVHPKDRIKRWKILEGDTVKVIAGDAKHQVGMIKSIDMFTNRVWVEGVKMGRITSPNENLNSPSESEKKGGLWLRPTLKAIHVSNVMHIFPDDLKDNSIPDKEKRRVRVKWKKIDTDGQGTMRWRRVVCGTDDVVIPFPPRPENVFKAGYVTKKDEMISHGVKAKRRTWRKVYLYLWGTLLRIYKNDPLDIHRAVPIREFGMDRAKINLAIDYTKRCNVLRVLISTGYQFIFQVTNRDDCVSWIEKFQSSVNISSSIDDREMPMFVTLPIRRQRGVNILPIAIISDSSDIGGSNSSDRNSSCTYNSTFSELVFDDSRVSDRYSLAITTTNGSTYQAFERIARELQQVQVDALPNQQLIW
ncbi:11218_t:CDS:2 [Dentiscutata erythropus]|uniref:11218_t:CDS:1 n=1 Tax=Dentiscutata erythropus TaxID=1348616 RepID=A0A9N9GFA9_9GLOM|nr:11218_t:CDS:2 [Dentiscutata erythropus]